MEKIAFSGMKREFFSFSGIVDNSVPTQFHNGISSKTYLSIFLPGARSWNAWQRIYIISVWKIISFHFSKFFFFFLFLIHKMMNIKYCWCIVKWYIFDGILSFFARVQPVFSYRAKYKCLRLKERTPVYNRTYCCDRLNDKIIKKEIFKSTLETGKLTNAIWCNDI